MTEDQRFFIGEIAVVCSTGIWNGLDVEIVSDLYITGAISIKTGEHLPPEPRYEIRLPDGSVGVLPPRKLRKKRPPGEQLGRWEDCVWRPSRELVA